MKKLLLSFTIVLFAVFSAKALVYTVNVPDGTKACYIAGAMNGWAQQEMTKVTDTQYTIDIPAATEADKYKYCSGPGWDFVEKGPTGEEITDRVYSAEDVVETWASVWDPGAQKIDTFLLTYGVEGGTDAWVEWMTEFVDNGNGTFSVSFELPENAADLSFWVGYNEYGNKPSWGGLSATVLMSTIPGYADVKAGDLVEVTVDKNSIEPNWGITMKLKGGLGIGSNNTDEVKCYNVNNTIQAQFEGTAKVQVFTVNGKLVNQISATDKATIGNLQSGLYIVKVNSVAKKVLVK